MSLHVKQIASGSSMYPNPVLCDKLDGTGRELGEGFRREGT